MGQSAKRHIGIILLGSIEDAVKLAAGERELLGALLVRSGHISNEKLDHAIADQQRSGEKLGEVFKRLGMLTERQLNALLDFQNNQGSSQSSPLRLGELLVATGHISRRQLEDALLQQAHSHNNLGEILIEAGFVRPGRIKYGIRLQKKLVNALLAAILSLSISTVSNASTVDLEWDPNVDSDTVVGYRVYYSTDPSKIAESTPVDVQKKTSATIDGLDPDKGYSFAVTAYNSAGQESILSNILTIDEQAPPTVAITSPTDAARVSGNVSISVNASDNIGVTRVEIVCNGALLFASNVSPYSFNWDTKPVTNGNYKLIAKAYDNNGNINQSSSVTVTVNNPVPDLIAPTVNSFTLPAASSSLTVAVSSFTASDNLAVTGFMITESATAPAANATGWSSSVPTSYTFANEGAKTVYAWARDAAGNVSSVLSSSVTITAPQPDYTIADALQALRISVGLITATNDQLNRLDVAPLVNGKAAPDGKIDIADALVILRKAVGLVSR